MSAKLIINADDFGLTEGVDRAVQELANVRAITSATLMANGAAFDHAVMCAKGIPALGVGCHVVLTDGIPVCPPHEIPTLIGSDGKSFRPSLKNFWLAALLGRVSEADVDREASAQIEKLQRAGLSVTHVDTHKHTHVLPLVARPLLTAAERLAVPAIRNPFEHEWSLELTRGDLKRHLQVRLMSSLRKAFQSLPQIQRGTVVTTDGTIGISATGQLDIDVLRTLLNHLPEGTWELVCHPGYNDRDLIEIKTRLKETRDVERQALHRAFTESSSHPFPFELIHYGMLSAAKDPSSISPDSRVELSSTNAGASRS